MSEQKRKTVYLKGKLFWVKILGTPRPNYDGDAREWTFEFEPDAESMDVLREHGVADRVKDRKGKKNYEDREPFIILRRGEFKTTGERNEKIRVVDAANQSWSERSLIGNGTEADVKVQIVDWGPRKKKGIYPLAIRILEYVPYTPDEFAPLADDDPRVQAVKHKDDEFRKDFGLDDPSEPEDQEEQAPETEPEQEPTSAGPLEDPLDDEVPV